jgi:tRNA-dihydrouridine synthase B
LKARRFGKIPLLPSNPSGLSAALRNDAQAFEPANTSASMKLGSHHLTSRVFVAPMAGVTDRPYRQLCRRLGASYAVSEMASSKPDLRHSVKTLSRTDLEGEPQPRSVQIAGADPTMMADAARFSVDRGAQVIDINMGCPAKKVCNVQAGSALMANEPLAIRIIDAVANAVPVPVTVRMRTGPTPGERNAARLALEAERAGAAMITVHGRSRACGFSGQAEYLTIAEVKSAVRVPVVANGDIASAAQAREVLAATGADAVMIGRAGLGRPWLYGLIDRYLTTGTLEAEPDIGEVAALLREHLLDHYAFHGEPRGVRTARKHVAWYLTSFGQTDEFLQSFYRLETAEEQLTAIDGWLAQAGRR